MAAPIGQILGSQAIVHVLSATRYQTVVGGEAATCSKDDSAPPPWKRSTKRSGEPLPWSPERQANKKSRSNWTTFATRRKEPLRAEEEFLLLALFGEEAEPLLRAIRER